MSWPSDEHSRLSRASLSVCKQCAVVALQNLIQHRADDVLVYHRLVGLGPKDDVEGVFAGSGHGNETKAAGWGGGLYDELCAACPGDLDDDG